MLVVKNLPANAGGIRHMGVWSLGWEDPLEEGNGNPLQFPCLEVLTDRGSWRATSHRIAKNQTRLKWLSMHTRTARRSGGILAPRRAGVPLECSLLLTCTFSCFPQEVHTSPHSLLTPCIFRIPLHARRGSILSTCVWKWKKMSPKSREEGGHSSPHHSSYRKLKLRSLQAT